MLKFPCLILDHDDTVVQSEATVNYPFFCYILDQFRPGQTITLEEYTQGCFDPGFSGMCREKYNFTDQELVDEYRGWQAYVREHVPAPYPGIDRIIRRQKEEGGMIFVVSHSCNENITRDYSTHFGILPDGIYGWDLPEEHRKPSTYPLEQIMEKYGFSPSQMLVVDDMRPGYEMARKAGIPIAFSAWGRFDYPKIVAEMTRLCDYSFSSTEALEHFLFDDEPFSLQYRDIRIRHAAASDAQTLAAWWNDGKVMAHAGFPLGLGTTPEKIANDIAKDTDDTRRRLILLLKDIPIGEMVYRNVGDNKAEIGIKICEADFQEKGIGRIALSLLIRHLLSSGYTRIELDTNLNNTRAQHVYELLGFQKLRVNLDSWTNQLGQRESSVDYALTQETFVDFAV